MDFTPVLVTIFAAVIVVVVVLTVLGSVRQRRGRARHVGARQPQRGRVFSNAPSHSTTPDSWG
ncbi:MAG TPA: hypothetical protein VF867_04420 [Arthrobacter sp.]